MPVPFACFAISYCYTFTCTAKGGAVTGGLTRRNAMFDAECKTRSG